MEESFDEQLTQLFEDLELRNPPETCQMAYDALTKVLSRIVENPDNDRCRVWKKRYRVMQEKILPCVGMMGLLMFLGFSNMDRDYMIFRGTDFTNLEIAMVVANSRLPGIKDAIAKQEAEKRMVYPNYKPRGSRPNGL